MIKTKRFNTYKAIIKQRSLFALAFIVACGSISAQSIIDTNFTANTTIYLNSSGKTTLALDTNSYNTNKDSIYLGQTNYDCGHVNVNIPILVSITDTSVVPATTYFSGSTIVNTLDTVAPFPLKTKSPQALVLPPLGSHEITMNDVLQAAPEDSCGIDTVYFNPRFINCSHTSSYHPIETVTIDVNGNQTSATTMVKALDLSGPTIIPKTTLVLDSLGSKTITSISEVLVSVNDACGLDSVYYATTGTTYTCQDTVTDLISIFATDIHGNLSKSFFTLKVVDVTPPSFTVTPFIVGFLDGNGHFEVDNNDMITGPVFDACGVADTTVSQYTFNCDDVGIIDILVDVSDISGNTATDTVVVQIHDTIAPDILTQPYNLSLDTNGNGSVEFFDLVTYISDNCDLDTSSFQVTPYQFNCSNVGNQLVKVFARDIYNNDVTKYAVVIVEGVKDSIDVTGPTTLCKNSFNVKYTIQDYNPQIEYTWDITNGSIVSTSHMGREVYVHWSKDEDNAKLKASGSINTVCHYFERELDISLQGIAPDTATIEFWNTNTNNTLVIKDESPHYYQWGYDEIVSGNRVSKKLDGEQKNSYYNNSILDNIQNLGYIYWCQTSYNNGCWTRSYYENQFPVSLEELATSHVQAWPLPFNGELNLTTTTNMKQVKIFNLQGALVFSQGNINSKEFTITEFESLQEGTYLLHVLYQDGSFSNSKVQHIK